MPGINKKRFKDNPLEERFVKAFQEQNQRGNILEWILSTRVNERQPVPKDWEDVAYTVVQWLGSPVGQVFLSDVLRIDFRKTKPPRP